MLRVDRDLLGSIQGLLQASKSPLSTTQFVEKVLRQAVHAIRAPNEPSVFPVVQELRQEIAFYGGAETAEPPHFPEPALGRSAPPPAQTTHRQARR